MGIVEDVERKLSEIRKQPGYVSPDVRDFLDGLEDRQIGAEILKRFKGRLTVAMLAFMGIGILIGLAGAAVF